ncbi:hypothetical protein Vretifemale_5476 [Volvox reticuliferus]|uniref:Reverse transcriptase domain-containing protein n=1 Tax=Volvox reticuliferus TaxID=1737510 RepID=A0A8J4C9A7_9CHLO|nr:hypothetical protein Vretifemale_5476 [Volvox reticuliferus]
MSASYRPITLLGTDYCTLVLVRRLQPVLDKVINPTQTVFLSGHPIADRLLLQLLPVYRGHRTCIMALLDFFKALDTSDREFLFQCFSSLRVGDGFIAWSHRLLTRPRSVALVNGYLPDWVDMARGFVRVAPCRCSCTCRRCRHCCIGFGTVNCIGLSDIHLMALQFTDDCAPVLMRLADLTHFTATMATFQAASGQCLNPAKVELLALGSFNRETQPVGMPPRMGCHHPSLATAAPTGPATAAHGAPVVGPFCRFATHAGEGYAFVCQILSLRNDDLSLFSSVFPSLALGV